MLDVSDMTNSEYNFYCAREGAAREYEREGFEWFAPRVRAGLADETTTVRKYQFFRDCL